MKTTTTFCVFLLCFSMTVFSQNTSDEKTNSTPTSDFCKTSEVMEEYYKANPQAKIENEALEAFTAEYAKNRLSNTSDKNAKTSAVAKYRIPVVFHVYGNNFWGKTLTDAQIINALAETNKDIQGLQADYATVNTNFAAVKSTIDLSFELAKLDPNGNATTGIDRKTTTGAGYAKSTGYDAQIAADAWDNKKHFNVYIVKDLFNDGVASNSGVCYFPDVLMTNSKTARCVYNGQYLGTNTNGEFRSVLTHEFGHFLNLRHTFENGCNAPGDYVDDTPFHSSTTLGCPSSQTSNTPVSNCGSWVINSENFMDYNGCNSCYKNYTKGQVARMEAALNLNNVSRFPLWQTSNLVATGLLSGVNINENNSMANIDLYPNPTDGIFQLDISGKNAGQYQYEITDVVGKIIFSEKFSNNPLHIQQISLLNQSQGLYFLHLTGENCDKTIKIIKQ